MSKRPLLKTGKKTLVCALSAALAVAFTPAVAWGSGGSGAAGADLGALGEYLALVDTNADGKPSTGDTGYSTLDSAIRSVGGSGKATVFLMKSAEESVVVGSGTYIDLELQKGARLKAPGNATSAPAITNNGYLDITGAGDGSSAIAGNGASPAILNNALLSVCDVVVTNSGTAPTIKTLTSGANNMTFLGNGYETSTVISNSGGGSAVDNGRYCLLAISGKSTTSCVVSSQSGPTILNKGFASVSGGTVIYTGAAPTSTSSDDAANAAALAACAIATVNADGSIAANAEGSNTTQLVIGGGKVDGGKGYGIANLESYSLPEGASSESSMLVTDAVVEGEPAGAVAGDAGAVYLSASTTISPKIEAGTVGESGRAVIYAGESSKGYNSITGGVFCTDPSEFVDYDKGYKHYQKADGKLWGVGKLYTITFDANAEDASLKSTSTMTPNGSLLDLPTLEPERTGYYLDGWWTKDESGQLAKRWDFSADTMPEADLTLYAKWAEGERPPAVNEIATFTDPATGTVFLGKVASDDSDMLMEYWGIEADGIFVIRAVLDGSGQINTGITELTIPSTAQIAGHTYAVLALHNSAFKGCTKLKRVTLPSDIVYVGKWAFEGCTALQEVAGGVPACYFEGALRGCTSLKSITVGADGASIDPRILQGCSALEKLTITGNPKGIGAYAFKGCASLKKVTIPSSVVTIERSIFSRCSSLKSMTIPAKVESIGKYAFYKSGVKTLTVKSTKLTKAGVKDCLKGSNVIKVKVPKSKLKAYKKLFTKQNCGKSVKVVAA